VITLVLLTAFIGIFIPAALLKRIRHDEAVAVGGLKAIYTASAAFYNSVEPGRYPTGLQDLGGPDQPHLDASLAAGIKAGYRFTLVGEAGADGSASFTAEAHPTLYRRLGVRSFYIDETGRLLGEDIGGFAGHRAMSAWDEPGLEEEEANP
jgi:hypothetical protein